MSKEVKRNSRSKFMHLKIHILFDFGTLQMIVSTPEIEFSIFSGD